MIVIDHLVVVGGGVLEQRNGHYFAKAAVANYLGELCGYFPKVSFMGSLLVARHKLYDTPLDVRITPLPWRLGLRRENCSTLLRLIRSLGNRSAVLLFIPQTPLLPLMPFFRLFSKKFIVYVAGDWIEIAKELKRREKSWRIPFDNAAASLPLSWADAVLVRGPKLRQQAFQYNENVHESLPIVALGPFLGERLDSCRGENVNILYVGKLLRGKGLGFLIGALHQLREDWPELGCRIRLSVLGTGADEESLRQQAVGLRLEGVVQFEGYVDNADRLADAYSKADILVMPSQDSEGLPRVLEEALLYSLPVIATRTGGIPWAYIDGEEILMVPTGSVDALALAIREIMTDAALRRRLIENGSRHAALLKSGYTAARQHAEVILGRPLQASDRGSTSQPDRGPL